MNKLYSLPCGLFFYLNVALINSETLHDNKSSKECLSMETHDSQLATCLQREKSIIDDLKLLFKTQLESCARAVIASKNRSTYRNSRNTEIDFIPTLYTLCFKIKYLLIHSLRLRINNE